MKKSIFSFKCILLTILICINSFALFGCNFYGYDYRDDSEELVVFDAIDFSFYEYSEKAIVEINYGDLPDREDLLCLAVSKKSEDKYWLDKRQCILSGKFKKIGWHDYKLFILMDHTYYVFDIKSYDLPELDRFGKPINLEYNLDEYSKTELLKKFPDYETYDWWSAHE